MFLMRALCDGRDNNPTHKETFNTFISELKKKNPRWDRITIGCERSMILQGLSSRRNTMMDTMFALIPKGNKQILNLI
jgi:hypothetical protein